MTTTKQMKFGKSVAIAGVGLSLGLLLQTAGSGAALQRVPSDSVRQNLYATCFLDDSEGWAVGDLGRIFHTKDGAETWEIQGMDTKRPFVGVSCVDGGHVWVAGQAGQVGFSADGGATWNKQESGTERQLLDIAFVDASRGIVVGDFGVLLRTEDGGKTWTKISLPTDIPLPEDIAEVVPPGDVVLYSISWVDRDHVWVAGEFGVILASADGGLTWQAQISTVETTLFGIFFADRMRGWAVGLEANLLATTDGGTTWKKQKVETPPGFELALYDLQVRGKRGWAVGNSGFLLHSQDGGASWHLVDVPPQMGSYWFRGVSLQQNGKGFVVGSTGLVVSIENDSYRALKERL